jgi:acyl-CoA thioester hydrolase
MKGYPVTVKFPVHWGEMDALGHVNNARYFTWFETARIAHFGAIGLKSDAPSELGPILKRADCDFIRPVLWPADVIVGSRITGLRNTSFTMEYAVARSDSPDEHFARGTAIVVLLNYKTSEKVQISDELRERIASVEKSALQTQK